MTESTCLLSIIIPAYNEENYIAKTLAYITKYAPNIAYEVIVVDNGSTDNTANLVKEKGAKVVSLPIGTIAAVRNKGVSASSGDILVFLDADILVTKEWQKGLDETIQQLSKNKKLITGSRCEAPRKSNWLNKYWFSMLSSSKVNYINSGHLITTRTLFDEVNGFTERLKTAEDYDFCMKAKQVGAEIKQALNLRVIHEGYPESVLDFMRRERWHGREDFETLNSFLSSKVAWVAAFNFIFLLASLILLAVSNSSLLVAYLPAMFFISICLTLMKFSYKSIYTLTNSAIIFYVYICGRTLALIDRLLNFRSNKFR